VFDMRGFWPDERVDGNVWNLNSPLYNAIYKFFKYMERKFIQNADRVITLTFDAKEYISKNFSLKNEIIVIPCAADLEHFQPQPISVRKKMRERYGIKDEFILGYLGSVGTWYMLNEMLDFFKCACEIKTNMRFFFLTNDKPEEILSLVKSKQLNKKQFIITSCGRNEIPQYIAAW